MQTKVPWTDETGSNFSGNGRSVYEKHIFHYTPKLQKLGKHRVGKGMTGRIPFQEDRTFW